MAKQDANAERAARFVEVLKQQREPGGTYPLTVAKLREKGCGRLRRHGVNTKSQADKIPGPWDALSRTR